MSIDLDYAQWFTLAALLWVFRALAATAGALVLVDWFQYRRHPLREEFPPYNRRQNSRAWAFAATGAILGGVGLFAFDSAWPGWRVIGHPNIAVTTIWGCWSIALVQRAASRAVQPRLIYAASLLVTVGGFVVVALGGRPG